MKLTPASAARPMMANEVGSSAWLAKVMVPRQSSETFRPVLPIRRIFMLRRPVRHRVSDAYGVAQKRGRWQEGESAREVDIVRIKEGRLTASPNHRHRPYRLAATSVV